MVTFILGESLITQQHDQLKQRTYLYAEFMKNRLQGLVAIRSSAMEQMANRWSHVGVFSPPAWGEDTQQYLTDVQGFEAIARLDRFGKPLWGCTVNGAGKITNEYPEFEPLLNHWWQTLPLDDSPAMSPLVALKSGRKGVWMVLPLKRSDAPDQFLAAAVPLSEVLQWLVTQFEVDHYGSSLRDLATNSKIEYTPTGARLYSVVDVKLPLQLWDHEFELEAVPTVAFADIEQDVLPTIVIFLGLSLALALVYAIGQAQRARLQFTRQIEDNLRLQKEIQQRELSEARFRAVAEAANDAIVITDAQGAILTWNKSAEAIFGHTAEEILGQNIARIIPSRFQDAHAQGMRRVAQGGAARVIGRSVELFALHKEGREFPIELSLSSWVLGGTRYFSGILRDISQRKQSEIALREA
ncbi:MAG: PAS domain S-box protein, partial [Armatimonadota bacterium]